MTFSYQNEKYYSSEYKTTPAQLTITARIRAQRSAQKKEKESTIDIPDKHCEKGPHLATVKEHDHDHLAPS